MKMGDNHAFKRGLAAIGRPRDQESGQALPIVVFEPRIRCVSRLARPFGLVTTYRPSRLLHADFGFGSLPQPLTPKQAGGAERGVASECRFETAGTRFEPFDKLTQNE